MTEDEARELFRASADRLGVGDKIVERILSGEDVGDVLNKKQRWAIEAVGKLAAGVDLGKVAKELGMTEKELLRNLEVPKKFHAMLLNRTIMQLSVVMAEVPQALLDIVRADLSDKNMNGKGQVCRLLMQSFGLLGGDLTPRDTAKSRDQLVARVKELQHDTDVQAALAAAEDGAPEFLDFDEDPQDGSIH